MSNKKSEATFYHWTFDTHISLTLIYNIFVRMKTINCSVTVDFSTSEIYLADFEFFQRKDIFYQEFFMDKNYLTDNLTNVYHHSNFIFIT